MTKDADDPFSIHFGNAIMKVAPDPITNDVENAVFGSLIKVAADPITIDFGNAVIGSLTKVATDPISIYFGDPIAIDDTTYGNNPNISLNTLFLIIFFLDVLLDIVVQNEGLESDMPMEVYDPTENNFHLQDFDESIIDIKERFWKLSDDVDDTENYDDNVDIDEQFIVGDSEFTISNLDEYALDGFGEQSTNEECAVMEERHNEDNLLEVILSIILLFINIIIRRNFTSSLNWFVVDNTYYLLLIRARFLDLDYCFYNVYRIYKKLGYIDNFPNQPDLVEAQTLLQNAWIN